MTLRQPLSPELDRAADSPRAGQLVAFATETVYGLGGDAANPLAVARIFETKGRPRFNPLIAHFADTAAAFAVVQPDQRAHALQRPSARPPTPSCPAARTARSTRWPALVYTQAVRVPRVSPASVACSPGLTAELSRRAPTPRGAYHRPPPNTWKPVFSAKGSTRPNTSR